MWKNENELNLPESIDFYIELMNKKRNENIIQDGVREIKRITEFIKTLSKFGYKFAVASSSPRKKYYKYFNNTKVI
ncbi:MAG TPA: HAD hydrolase-like protein [Lactovum miscens]|uniref:HAD hydrolase-like protein n=1 Tax=Lactovum miscens TaxID=190387 RepID=UPI002ED88C57